MIDQLIIGEKASFDDFEASVNQRKISKPKKKSIRETVPFSNIVYDFTAINGEIYWEERDLEYILEIIADTPKELEEKKRKLASWLMNITDEVLKDPFIPDYHFRATFDDMEEEDEESIEKTTITVNFKAYPYMIANTAKVFNYNLVAGVDKEVTIVNESSHRITPSIDASIALSVTLDDITYNVPAGIVKDDSFKFKVGSNQILLKSQQDGVVTFTVVEEVF